MSPTFEELQRTKGAQFGDILTARREAADRVPFTSARTRWWKTKPRQETDDYDDLRISNVGPRGGISSKVRIVKTTEDLWEKELNMPQKDSSSEIAF